MTDLSERYRGILWLGLLSGLTFGIVVVTQPASYSDGLSLSALLVSVFFSLMALVAWIGVAVRTAAQPRTGERVVYAVSLRQGLISGILAVTLLVLQLLRVITHVDALILVALAVVTELYFASRTHGVA